MTKRCYKCRKFLKITIAVSISANDFICESCTNKIRYNSQKKIKGRILKKRLKVI